MIVLLFTFSCNNEKKAVVFNDSLTEQKQLADNDFTILNRNISISLKDSNYAYIAEIVTQYTDSLNNRLQQSKQLNFAGSDNEFQKYVILYIETLIRTAQSYRGYNILSDEKATPSQLDSVYKIVRNNEFASDSVLQILVLKQREFAKNNNFKLSTEK
ncbi:MAG: hypothetical protein ACLVKO_12085 [Dysgonomonas sp.]